ncbi:HNH endonuclease [Rhodococcus sp. ARC_M12]|uniref:HNH endonuclease n=1 Tax=Rhodococcus sp. ARC_M12 TaxID=2928854 RepID=UPI0035B2710C
MVNPEILDLIAEGAAKIGYSLDDFLTEKLVEVQGRAFIRLIPAHHLSEQQARAYQHLVLGCEPTDRQIKSTRRQPRTLNISDEERVALERQQNDRCGVCGRFLDAESKPHVDHRWPIALGGEDSLDNLQLLCQGCNLGKGSLPLWQMGIPYLERRMTSRLRYCVLARAAGGCELHECSATVKNSELIPTMIVAAAEGGSSIFDNLMACCTDHQSKIVKKRVGRAELLIQRSRDPLQRRVGTARLRMDGSAHQVLHRGSAV